MRRFGKVLSTVPDTGSVSKRIALFTAVVMTKQRDGDGVSRRRGWCAVGSLVQVPTLSSHVPREGWARTAIQGIRPFSAQLEGVGRVERGCQAWGGGTREVWAGRPGGVSGSQWPCSPDSRRQPERERGWFPGRAEKLWI